MGDEKLKSWIEEKLDEGVDEQRIRNSLREEGFDPGLVDEVKGPEDPGFDQGDVDISGSSDVQAFSPAEREDSPVSDTGNTENDWNADTGNRGENSQDSTGLEIGEKEEHLKEMAGKVEQRLQDNWKTGLAFVSVVALLSGAILVLPHADLGAIVGELENPVADKDRKETPNPASQDQASQDQEPGVTRVVLRSGRAEPSEVSVAPGEDVVFVNQAGQELEVDFERLVEDFRLEAGRTRTVTVDAMVYYTASPVNGGQNLHGSINVE